MSEHEHVCTEPAKGGETAGIGSAGLETLRPQAPGVLDALARLPDKTLLTESALARALSVSKRTIRRMVSRFELPPAVRFGGRSCWQAGAVLRWFEARAERLARQAERAADKFRQLTA